MTNARSCKQCCYRNSSFSEDIELTASCDHPDLHPDGLSLDLHQAQAPDWCPLGIARSKENLVEFLNRRPLGGHSEVFDSMFAIRWEPVPYFSCPKCNGLMEKTCGLMLASPWAGSVRCTKCNYQDSVSGYLGKSIIEVQPMPPGALPFFTGPGPSEQEETERLQDDILTPFLAQRGYDSASLGAMGRKGRIEFAGQVLKELQPKKSTETTVVVPPHASSETHIVHNQDGTVESNVRFDEPVQVGPIHTIYEGPWLNESGMGRGPCPDSNEE